MVDANAPMIWGKHKIKEFEGHNYGPLLSVTDVITKSSNVGTAHIALMIGPLRQQGAVELGGRAVIFRDGGEPRHLLGGHVGGNPHSANPSSAETTRQVERTRAAVLAYFNGTGQYTAVFTLNASGALKLVGESYPFEPGGRLLLTVDNHNSVNGIREFARAKGARVDYAPLQTPELRLDAPALDALLAEADPARANLLAFPAQSNFSGVRHPLTLIATARSRGWHVLLDAAAFVPTNRLDLRATMPDFVTVSFYKMFGYPCLLYTSPSPRDRTRSRMPSSA